MKTIIILILLSFSLISLAETANYSVQEGKLHKGGSLSVEVLDETNGFKVRMKYEIKKRPWIPISADQLKGETLLDLPEQFKDERGYLELESVGEMKVEGATIKFVKRVNIGTFKDAFEAEIFPNNGRSKTTIIYHPLLKSAGWGKVEIKFISDVPLLNGYTIIAAMN